MNAYSKVETKKVTTKGQVLIPKAVRDITGLQPNAPYKVMVNDQNQAVVAPIGYGPENAEERVRRMRDGIAALRGTGQSGKSTDEIMRELRGDWQP